MGGRRRSRRDRGFHPRARQAADLPCPPPRARGRGRMTGALGIIAGGGELPRARGRGRLTCAPGTLAGGGELPRATAMRVRAGGRVVFVLVLSGMTDERT